LVEQWSQTDLNNAMLYGYCLICMTPRETRRTVTEKNGETHTLLELVRPCGHTERDIDRVLAEDE
jgi:hypothetical protein